MIELPTSRCRSCPLYNRLHYYVPSTVDGDNRSQEQVDFVLVGEAPGEWEVTGRWNPRLGRKVQEGFMGPAGRLLDKLLKRAGLDRSRCRLTNVLKCQPKNNKLPDDLDTAIWACSELLEKEIVGAKVVIGFGNVPLQAFKSLGNITKRRGSVYTLSTGQPFVPTLHPAYLLRQQHMTFKETKEEKPIPQEVVEADITKAIKVARGELKWGEAVLPEYTLEPTEADKMEFLERLYEPERLVAVDIETTRDKPLDVVPLLIGFSFMDWSLCVEFEDEHLEFIIKALESPTPKIFQNGLFDDMVLRNIGIETKNWTVDTFGQHHLLYSELPHNLGFIGSLCTTLEYHKGMKDDLEDWDK